LISTACRYYFSIHQPASTDLILWPLAKAAQDRGLCERGTSLESGLAAFRLLLNSVCWPSHYCATHFTPFSTISLVPFVKPAEALRQEIGAGAALDNCTSERTGFFETTGWKALRHGGRCSRFRQKSQSHDDDQEEFQGEIQKQLSNGLSLSWPSRISSLGQFRRELRTGMTLGQDS
jgi:hypothetical protein